MPCYLNWPKVLTIDIVNGDKTDHHLWMDIRASDESSFTELFQRYHRTLYNYGSKLTSNTAIVEDAVQDVFIDVWRLRHNLSEDVISVKFYLYRALRRRVHKAHDKFPLTEEISSVHDHEMPVNPATSETILIATESSSIRASRIRQLLAQLPERQVEALTLRYFDDFGINEIALIMGVSEKSVRNFIYKALTSLRQNGQTLTISVLIVSMLLLF